MDTSSGDGDREVIAGGFDRESVVQELMLNGIVIVEAQERIFAKHVRQTKKVEMKRMIADDETVIGECPEQHGLFAWNESKRFLDRLDACDQVGVGAGAADARHELGDCRDGLAFHRVRVEALEFFDGEFDFFDGAVFNKHIQPGRAFDLGNFLNAELAQFGYLMHRIFLSLYPFFSAPDSFGTIPNSASILSRTARKADSVMGQPWTRSSTVTMSSSFLTFSPWLKRSRRNFILS